MKGKKVRNLLALSLTAAVVAALLASATRTPKRVGGWTVSTRSVTDWLRPYHHYNVLTHANGARSVQESRTLFVFALSRPLRGPKADQMIAFYEQLPRKAGTHYMFVQAPH